MSEIRWWEHGTSAGAGQRPSTDVIARKNWPNPSDYARSVQRERPFHDPELLNAKVGTTPLGLPAMATGENAIVFKVHANEDTYAVRCFTPKMGSPNDAIYRHLQQIDCPKELVEARWVDGGITVNSESWPILVMPWIDGQTLNAWLADNAHDRDAVLAVRDRLRATHAAMRNANLVHGDLHHGNILIAPTGDIRLIDFDGMCAFDPDTNALVTPQPSEVGHPNYQHPQRIRLGSWHPFTDTFGALLIDVSLTVIAAEPDLYQNSGDHLIFTAEDLEDPSGSAQFSRARTLGVTNSSNSHGEEPIEYLHLLTTLSEWCKHDETVEDDFADLLVGHMPDFRALSPESVLAVSRKDGPVENEWGSKRVTSATEKEAMAVSAPSYTASDRDLIVGRVVGIIMVAAVILLVIIGVVTEGGRSSTSTTPSSQPSTTTQSPRPAPPPAITNDCIFPESRPAITQGDRGDDVFWLQSRLKLTTDGNFGPATARAVRSFQQSQDLPVTGVVDTWEWALLGLTCPSRSSEFGRYVNTNNLPSVGTCFTEVGERGVVSCDDHYDGVVVMTLRNDASDRCLSYYWWSLGGNYSYWSTTADGSHTICFAPTMLAIPE